MSISFDDVPYEGRVIHTGRPEALAVEAWLRGVRVRHPGRARILELGCAEGANTGAIAYHLADAEVVGVDASRRHIELANAMKDELGLDNLRYFHAGIEALPDEVGGDFDYILCHGVLSWVPEDVREAIFRTLAERLTPRGVGYVSYNVAPGWAMRGLVRQVLRAHTRHLEGPQAKLDEARALLSLMSQTPFTAHHYGAYMAAEAADTLQHREPYIAHEYLAEENHPFTYGEIVRLAERHGLTFLSELSPVAHRGIEERLREVVGTITDDPVEREELADVLSGRAFRASLFCRAGVEVVSAEEGRDRLLDVALFVTTLHPVAARPSLGEGDAEEFADKDGIRVTVTHPLLKAALLELARSFPAGVRFDELADRALALLHLRRVRPVDRGVSTEERAALRDDLVRLVSLRHLDLRLTEPPFVLKAGERPRVSTLTRFEARRADWVTSGFHESLHLDEATRFLIELLDGSRDRDELTDQLAATLREHAVELRDEAGAPLDGDAARRAMRVFVDRHLLMLESQGVMER